MPIRHSVCTVDKVPEPLSEGILLSEQFLEGMIVAAPEILSDQRMIIGRCRCWVETPQKRRLNLFSLTLPPVFQGAPRKTGGAKSSMLFPMVEAFAEIDKEEVDPILTITTMKAA